MLEVWLVLLIRLSWADLLGFVEAVLVDRLFDLVFVEVARYHVLGLAYSAQLTALVS